MKFIKLPNKIFDLGLKPTDIMVFAALKTLDKDYNNCVKCSAVEIADLCGIHRNSVGAAIKHLVASGIIRKANTYNSIGNRTANKYYLLKTSYKFFMLPCSIFSYKLKPSAFAVYAYFVRCSNKSGRAFPSLKKIAYNCNICINTVISAFRELNKSNLVSKKSYISIHRDYGCNNYLLHKMFVKIKLSIKKVARHLLKAMRTTTFIYTIIVNHDFHFVNCLFSFFYSYCKKKRRLLFYFLGVLQKLCNSY